MIHARSDYNGRIIDITGGIPKDEPVFLLRGQDKLAPLVVAFWAVLLILEGGNLGAALMAYRHSKRMRDYNPEGKKLPDVPPEVLRTSGLPPIASFDLGE